MIVAFDLDDTLLDHTGAERLAALAFARLHRETVGPGDEAFVARWRTVATRHYRRFQAGELSFAEQRRCRVREILGRDLAAAEADAIFAGYLAQYEANWRAFPDVLPCLDRLAGHTLALITNGGAEQQRQKLAALGIAGRFAAVVTCEDAGCAKPDPRIFLTACAQLAAVPAQCLYVGDQLEKDARAAQAAGLRGVWLDRGEGGPAPGDVTVIHSLLLLPGIVGAGGEGA